MDLIKLTHKLLCCCWSNPKQQVCNTYFGENQLAFCFWNVLFNSTKQRVILKEMFAWLSRLYTISLKTLTRHQTGYL